jgi:hypothetical protein
MILHKYLTTPVAASYGISEKMRTDGVVPRKYLQISTQRTPSFTNHRAGQNGALDAAIRSLIDSGYIVEMSKDKSLKDYEFTGRCFRIVNLPRL